jgi:hypothetical protein
MQCNNIANNPQALVREVFSQKFGVTSDEDYALHVPPPRSVIKLFASDESGPGPDADDLRIDMRSPISTAWNQEVVNYLLGAVLEKVDKEDKWGFLPERSDAYFAELIEDKMKRAKTNWLNAQQKFNEDGEKETIEEVEERMVTTKEEKGKIARTSTRRQSVRFIHSVHDIDLHL